jgi:ankyrin repeat protein
MVRLLHSFGADLRSASRRPWLHAQASAFDDNPLIALLVELGWQPDEQDDSGWTALHHAASVGYTRNVEILLKSGADPRVATARGLTAADLANRNGWNEIAARLPDT